MLCLCGNGLRINILTKEYCLVNMCETNKLFCIEDLGAGTEWQNHVMNEIDAHQEREC